MSVFLNGTVSNKLTGLAAGDICPLPPGGGPVRPACKPPAVAPQNFKLHAERGWYGNLSTMKEIGGKGEMALDKCAEACRGSGSCLAFHGYFGGGGNCSELKGDCYIHSAPLGAFVGGDSRAILYDRHTVAPLPVKSDDDGVSARLPAMLTGGGSMTKKNPDLMKLSFLNAATPFLPPNRSSTYDSTVCMNPNIVKVGSTWRLYYAGADNHSNHRIALATAPVTGPTPANALWTRQGVVLGTGKPGTFNSAWSVLPLVKKFGDLWHLYFTGRSSSGCPYTNKTGLQSFWGIGLATSTDGLHFTQHRAGPIILGNATSEYPDNYGVAGGGSLIEDGAGGYRFYYTLAVGTTSHDVKVDQKKVCAVAHSKDGIHFYNSSVVMGPLSTSEQPREDIACAAPVVWRDAAGVYRMIYSAIGTKWGFYSLAQAASADGYSWYRGEENTDQDLVLAPSNKSSFSSSSSSPPPRAWDSQMVEYASVWRTSSRLGLFYAGNGYGRGGIGYAESSVLFARMPLKGDDDAEAIMLASGRPPPRTTRIDSTALLRTLQKGGCPAAALVDVAMLGKVAVAIDDILFDDITGTSRGETVGDLDCALVSRARRANITLQGVHLKPAGGGMGSFKCANAPDTRWVSTTLAAKCKTTDTQAMSSRRQPPPFAFLRGSREQAPPKGPPDIQASPLSTLLLPGQTSFELTVNTTKPSSCHWVGVDGVPHDLDGSGQVHTGTVAGLSGDARLSHITVQCNAFPLQELHLTYRSMPDLAAASFPLKGNLWGSSNFMPPKRSLEYAAAHVDMWLGANWKATDAAALRKLNPATLVLTSINACEGPDGLPEELYLHNITRPNATRGRLESWPGAYRLDVTKPETQRYQATLMYNLVRCCAAPSSKLIFSLAYPLESSPRGVACLTRGRQLSADAVRWGR